MYSYNELLDKIGEYKTYGSEYRFYECPICGHYSHTNPAFSVNSETGQYYCHCCNTGGHINSLTGMPLQQMNLVITPPNKWGVTLYDGIEINEQSISAKYLLARGIKDTAWKDLNHKLREKTDGGSSILIYPFVDESGSIVAVQKTYLDKTGTKIHRQYEGKKSNGVAILKYSRHIIVAEGLETGLSVKQHLKECFGKDYGLIIAGDAGNLISLADRNTWALERKTEIIIAADNDTNEVGQKAAIKVYARFYPKSKLYIPSETGKDWNDLLKNKRIKENWI